MPSYSRKVSVPGISSQQLYDSIAETIQRMMEKASFGKFEINKDPTRKEVKLKSSMITATLSCGEESLNVDGQLSLLATPFRAKIDQGIDEWVARTFKTNKA